MGRLKIGIDCSSYFHYYKSHELAYERMAAHGYDCADAQFLCNTEQDIFHMPENEFEKRMVAERALCEAAGLSFSQSHGPWRCPPQDLTEEDRAERFEKMARAIRGTAYVGAPHFVIHCIMPYGCDSGEAPEVQMDMNREFFGRLLEVAEEYKVVIDLENLPFPKLPISRTNEVLDFVKSMNTPWMRMCLDTGHCSFYGDSPAESVRLIGKEYLTTLHIHDNDGPCDRHWEPGTGIIDWADFAHALREIDYEGVVSLETSVPMDVTDPALRDTRERALADIARSIAGGTFIQ